MKTIKHTFTNLLICLILIAGLDSCDQDDDLQTSNAAEIIIMPHDTQSFIQNFGSIRSHDFIGKVTNKASLPIAGATIKIGNEETFTNDKGVFILKDTQVNERFAHITIYKEGFLPSSRSLVPVEGSNQVTVTLLESEIISTIQSGSEETIMHPSGSSVRLEGEYVTSEGIPYDGAVQVQMHYLNPTSETIQDEMPGMYYGADKEGNEMTFKNYGILAVTLTDDNGEKLNLAPDSEAELIIPIAESDLAGAPENLQLGHFDEQNGYWIEEGKVIRDGGVYVGRVTHFSFWSIFAGQASVLLSIEVLNLENEPLSNMFIEIQSNSYGTRSEWTNEEGKASGYVPKDEPIEIIMYPRFQCDLPNLRSTDPFILTADEDLSLNLDFIYDQTVTGNFTNCDGNPVTNGYVDLQYKGRSYLGLVTNGSYDVNFISCVEQRRFSIRGFDLDTQQRTESIWYRFTDQETNLGIIAACTTLDEFIQYSIDGNDPITIFSNLEASLTIQGPQHQLFISGYEPAIEECIGLTGLLNPSQYIGIYETCDIENNCTTGFELECIDIDTSFNDTIEFNLNQLEGVSEFIDLNLAGIYYDGVGVQHNITGVVHIRRQQ